MKEELRNRFIRDLLGKRIIYPPEAEISAELAENIGRAIVWLNARSEIEPITIYIDSGGGSVKAGLDIYHIIKSSKAPVTGIVHRRADSMALVILQACTFRKAYRSGTFMAHASNVTLSLPELEDPEFDSLKRARANQREIECILAERTGRTVEEIHGYLWSNQNDEFMTADEALEYGLIDEIISD